MSSSHQRLGSRFDQLALTVYYLRVVYAVRVCSGGSFSYHIICISSPFCSGVVPVVSSLRTTPSSSSAIVNPTPLYPVENHWSMGKCPSCSMTSRESLATGSNWSNWLRRSGAVSPADSLPRLLRPGARFRTNGSWTEAVKLSNFFQGGSEEVQESEMMHVTLPRFHPVVPVTLLPFVLPSPVSFSSPEAYLPPFRSDVTHISRGHFSPHLRRTTVRQSIVRLLLGKNVWHYRTDLSSRLHSTR